MSAIDLNIGLGIRVGDQGTFGSIGENFYNQHFTLVNLNGRYLSGYMDGTPIRLTPQGGQVSTTEGTDGPGHNMATKQGHMIEVDLREESPDHEYIANINRAQYEGGGYVPLTLYTGTQRVFTCNVLVSQPGDLATGGPQQGSHTYTFITKKTDLY